MLFDVVVPCRHTQWQQIEGTGGGDTVCCLQVLCSCEQFV